MGICVALAYAISMKASRLSQDTTRTILHAEFGGRSPEALIISTLPVGSLVLEKGVARQ